MAQRVRRAIPPQKVSPSPLGDVYAIVHRAVAQWHTFPHGFTLAAKVFAVFDTHGDTVSFLACFGTVLRTAGLVCSPIRPAEGHWKRDHTSRRLCFLD